MEKREHNSVILKCDRCGKEQRMFENNAAVTLRGWDNDIIGQTLCPDCLKVFDAWFDKFMRRANDE